MCAIECSLSAWSGPWPAIAVALSAIVALTIAIRRTPIPAIAGRECKGLLFSPMGYWVLLCFSVFFWYLYHGGVERLKQMPRMSPYEITPLAAFFDPNTVAAALLMIVPAITMKLFPEEKSQGTYEFLLTCPVREWHIVAGKFLGAGFYYAILWLMSLFPIFLVSRLGPIDWGQVAAVYLWFLVCGLGFLALGVLVSSILGSQIACFVTTFTILLPFTGYAFSSRLEGPLYLSSHLLTACRGTVDFSCYFFSASMAAVALFATSKIIEVRRYFSPPTGRAAIIRIWVVSALGIAISPVIVFSWGVHFRSLLVLALLAAVCLHRTMAQRVFAANAAVSVISLAVIALAAGYLIYPFRLRFDISMSRAFTLNSPSIRGQLTRGELIEVTAMFAMSERPDHEHLERDNERYYILEEALRKLSESCGESLCYRFVPTATPEFSELQNRYGVGYRDLLFQYRGRCYIVSDAELFTRDLDPADVPQLLVLWRKIYEAGGIIEPPPDPKDENILPKLREKANPEMLAVAPAPGLEETLVNAIYRLVRGSPNRVYFAQGAGEKWVTGTLANEYQTAYRLAATLRRYNFEVVSLRLNSAEIPADCDALVILGTDDHAPYRREAIQLLDDYLKNRSGSLVVLVSENPDEGLKSLLRTYGIEVAPAVATWYDLSGETPQKKTMLDIPLTSTQQPLAEILKDMHGADGIPVIHIQRGRIVEAMKPAGIWAGPIWALENPRIFAESEKGTGESRRLPISVGAIAHNPGDGWKLAVIGNADFTGDSPSTYYQYIFGDPTPRPQILLGCNRLVVPALLKYLIKPAAKVPVAVAPPIRFRPRAVSDRLMRLYFWCNLLLPLTLAAAGIWWWRRDRR